jgi:RNA polymerase sigma-70 factor (ECF subfamily)
MFKWTKDKNSSEFEELLMQNIDSIYNLALRMTFNSQDAEDLVQETSIRAFNYFSHFKKGTNFRAWIMTIMRNLFINRYRKKTREPQSVALDKVVGFVPVPQVSGAGEEIFSEKMKYIISELPEELRTTLVLFYVNGFAYKDIARIMDVPIGTVMSRLYTARQMLKKKLAHFKEEGISRHGLPEN